MEPLALVGIVGLLLVKEAGVPIPVPGDLIVIGAGAALAGSGLGALAGLLLILGAGYLGGVIQFALVRGALRRPLLRLLERVGVPAQVLEELAARLRRQGARGVAIARMTPGVRIGSIAASSIAALPLPVFARGLVLGNGVFVGAHFVLGVAFGAAATSLLAQATASLIPLGGALLALSIAGAIGWRLVRGRRAMAGSALSAWTDAACPACLVAVAAIPGDEGA